MAGELPKVELKDYPIKVSIWQKTKRNDSGREYTESSFTISKTFKTQDGAYEERKLVLFPDDVLKLVAMLYHAYHDACCQVSVPKTKQQQQQGGKQPRR